MPCHNGQEGRGARGSEYSTWAVYDRHARAFAVLGNDKSKSIMRNLGRQGQPATADGLCLSCHVGPDWQAASRNPRFTLADGVGCESCHGAAGSWLTEHFKSGWNRKGMRDTRTINGRADSCVGCHVGSPGKDVNHDLIAAGHPRLNFEFAAFHAILPHHWDDRKDRSRYPDFEARAWAVGQLASAKAALELLAYRAESAHDPKKQPWPEFAEYDCFACHHDLQAKSWRQSKEHYGKRPPGALPWGDWYYSMTGRALGAVKPGRSTFAAALARLKADMERTYPPQQAVAKRAAMAATILNQELKGPEQGLDHPLSASRLFRAVLKNDWPDRGSTWDLATQFYLCLAAMHDAWGAQRRQESLPPIERRDLLLRLRRELQLPSGFDSPRDYDPTSPRGVQRQLKQR
jgi:hypothetical protein